MFVHHFTPFVCSISPLCSPPPTNTNTNTNMNAHIFFLGQRFGFVHLGCVYRMTTVGSLGDHSYCATVNQSSSHTNIYTYIICIYLYFLSNFLLLVFLASCLTNQTSNVLTVHDVTNIYHVPLILVEQVRAFYAPFFFHARYWMNPSSNARVSVPTDGTWWRHAFAICFGDFLFACWWAWHFPNCPNSRYFGMKEISLKSK